MLFIYMGQREEKEAGLMLADNSSCDKVSMRTLISGQFLMVTLLIRCPTNWGFRWKDFNLQHSVTSDLQ